MIDALGTSLVSLGRAHCQVAALQEAFSLNFDESYLTSIRKAEDEIKEYQTQRKKLESRRYECILFLKFIGVISDIG